MSSVQERLQLKRVPLDKWSVREQLCLASAVECSGDQNWMSVSRALKVLATGNRPSDWFSQKFCAAQYGKLLENVETPKRKKRTDRDQSGSGGVAGGGIGSSNWSTVETPGESILRKLTHERMSELNRLIVEEQREHQRIKEEIAFVQSTNDETELRRIWAQIEAEQRQQEKETTQQAQWLKEREQRKLELERAWRPAAGLNVYSPKASVTAAAATKATDPTTPTTATQSSKGSTPKHSTASSVEEAMDIEDPTNNQVGGLSPLLTSLLKNPTAGCAQTSGAQIIANSATTTAGQSSVSATASSRVAPTITNLLTGAKPVILTAPRPPPLQIVSSSSSGAAGKEALLKQSLTGPPPAQMAATMPTPPVQSPSQAAPTLSMLLENKNKDPAARQGSPLKVGGTATAAAVSQHNTMIQQLSAVQATVKKATSPSMAAVAAPTTMTTTATLPNTDRNIDVDANVADEEERLLLEEFNGLIPDNIDDLADILTDNNAGILNDEQLLDEADDSILDSVESLMAGAEADAAAADDAAAAAASSVVNTGTTATTAAAQSATIVASAATPAATAVSTSATVIDVDDGEDVEMVAELGDANDPIIDVAAATAAGAAAGEIMTTAELVEQLTSSEPSVSSSASAGFPLNLPPVAISSGNTGERKDTSKGATTTENANDDDDDEDDVVLIEAAIKKEELEDNMKVSTKSAAPAAQQNQSPPSVVPSTNASASAHVKSDKESTAAIAPIVVVENVDNASTDSPKQSSTKSEEADKDDDDDQSSSSNDAPLSELLKNKTNTNITKKDVMPSVAEEPDDEELMMSSHDVDSPKDSVRTDVFESDSNDDKSLEIIKREIHQLTGLKNESSNENSNESLSLMRAKEETNKDLEKLDQQPQRSDDDEEPKHDADDGNELIVKKEQKEESKGTGIESVVKIGLNIDVKIENVKKDEDEDPASIVPIEFTTSDDDEESKNENAGVEVDADDNNADDDDDDADFEDAKDDLMPDAAASPSQTPASRIDDEASIQIDDTEDDEVDQPSTTRLGKALAAAAAADAASAAVVAAAAAASATVVSPANASAIIHSTTSSAPAVPSTKATPANVGGGSTLKQRDSSLSRRRCRVPSPMSATHDPPGTPQPQSDTDSTASQRSSLTTRRRLRDRFDRDRSESPYIDGGDNSAVFGTTTSSSNSGGGGGVGGGNSGSTSSLAQMLDNDNERPTRAKQRRCSSSTTPLNDSMPNSPASSVDCAPGVDSRDQRAWRKAIQLVLTRLAQHRHAAIFQRPVVEEPAAYRQSVLRPMDLPTIKRNVDAGLLRTTVDFQRDVMLMCSNAIMYSGSDETVARMAAELEYDAVQSIETIMEPWLTRARAASPTPSVGGGGSVAGTTAMSSEEPMIVVTAKTVGAVAVSAQQSVANVTTASSSSSVTTTTATAAASAVATPTATSGTSGSSATSSATKTVRGRKSHRFPPAQ